MPTSGLPLEIKTFLIEFIDSVSHLEVLLMLSKHPQRSWTAATVAKDLRSNLSSASNQLHVLNQKGLLRLNEDKTYQFHASRKEIEEKIKIINELYQKMPVAIVTCIFDKPNEKLKSFADAFKIKKD